MFEFTKQTKQYEELAARIKEVNDLWVNIVLSTWEDFFKPKKKQGKPQGWVETACPTSKHVVNYVKRRNLVSAWLIIVTGVIYTYIAAEQGYKGNTGMAVCYIGYALGNVGLYMMATK